MTFTWFATFQKASGALNADEIQRLHRIIAATPGLVRGLIHTPWPVDGLAFDDGPAPALQVQLYFDDIAALEAAVGRGGHLQQLAVPEVLPSLTGAQVSEQAMLARDFPVPHAPDPVRTYCSFLVHYPGPADDLNLWLRAYIDGHTPIMQRFPGIRGVEVCSCLDWCSALPWQRVHHMQRNKVVFDDAGALKAALASPVLAELRADSAGFPPSAGGNAHFAMRTVQIDI